MALALASKTNGLGLKHAASNPSLEKSSHFSLKSNFRTFVARKKHRK